MMVNRENKLIFDLAPPFEGVTFIDYDEGTYIYLGTKYKMATRVDREAVTNGNNDNSL